MCRRTGVLTWLQHGGPGGPYAQGDNPVAKGQNHESHLNEVPRLAKGTGTERRTVVTGAGWGKGDVGRLFTQDKVIVRDGK